MVHARLLTTTQAAAEAGVSPATIRRWCDSGRIASTRAPRPGSHRRIYPLWFRTTLPAVSKKSSTAAPMRLAGE
ncbi:MAG: helix-turn-helix domain-containing protein [Phycisphaeraceae bacterium]